LKRGDLCVLCIKARSIDTVKDPKIVFREEKEKLARDFRIVEEKDLKPYDKDHMLLVLEFLG
jgi:fibrillarin-like pre-rRNA processing protein